MKKYQSFILILCLALVNIAILSGQPVHTSLRDVIMPSPEAAALGKYGDMPVSYATGTPSISIPIHTLQEGPLTLPISLSYHASGVRVAETASWVGMGWSLMAGGRITRTVMGLKDEGGGGYWTGGHEILPEPENPSTSEVNDYNNNIMCGILQGTRDGEPDLFSFSFNGYNGKFYFDSDNNVHQIPVSDLVIETDITAVDAGNFESFTIITTDGTRYYFGKHGGITEYESTWIKNFSENYRSGWMLIKMESADGLYSIDFDYDNESYKYKNLSSGTYTITNATGGTQATFPANNGSDALNRYYTWTGITGNRLYSITTSTETITLEANTDREDISEYLSGTCKRLDNIKIETGSFCKDFEFSYDYFVDSNEPANFRYAKRLKLEQVQEKSCYTSLDKNPYVFEYEGAYQNGKQFIIHRLSKAIDHWGYYNGASANEPLLVNVPETTIENPIHGTTTFTYGEADREADGNFAKIGTLKKITYPTKGYTEFDFEGNSLFGLTGYQKNLQFDLTNCVTPDASCCVYGDQDSDNFTFSTQEEIDEAVFNMGAVNPSVLGPGDYPCGQVTMNAKIQIFNVGSSVALGTYQIDLSIDDVDETVSDVPLSDIYANLSPNTNYTFKLTANYCKGTFSLSTQTPQYGDYDVGGVRIKSQLSHDNISSNNDIIKTYTYEGGNLIDRQEYAFAGYYATEV